MRIGYLTRRTVFLVPLVAAVLTLTTAAAPAAHSTLAPIAAPAGTHFAVESLCISGDPVCGQGWRPYEIGGQVIAAALCGLDKCPHLSYPAAPARDGASFLAEHAFRQAGGDG